MSFSSIMTTTVSKWIGQGARSGRQIDWDAAFRAGWFVPGLPSEYRISTGTTTSALAWPDAETAGAPWAAADPANTARAANVARDRQLETGVRPAMQ